MKMGSLDLRFVREISRKICFTGEFVNDLQMITQLLNL